MQWYDGPYFWLCQVALAVEAKLGAFPELAVLLLMRGLILEGKGDTAGAMLGYELAAERAAWEDWQPR